jgi:hypothetical protein
MTHIFAERSAEKRREGEALIRKPTIWPVKAGTNACGPMTAPSIRHRQSIKPSMADSRRDDGIEWRCGAFHRHSEAAVFQGAVVNCEARKFA